MSEAGFRALYLKYVDSGTLERKITSLSCKAVPIIDINNQPSDPAVAAVMSSRLTGAAKVPVMLVEAPPELPCHCGSAHARWEPTSCQCQVFGVTTFVDATCTWYRCSGCSREVHYDGGADAILNQSQGFKFTYELLSGYAHEFSTTKNCNFNSFL